MCLYRRLCRTCKMRKPTHTHTSHQNTHTCIVLRQHVHRKSLIFTHTHTHVLTHTHTHTRTHTRTHTTLSSLLCILLTHFLCSDSLFQVHSFFCFLPFHFSQRYSHTLSLSHTHTHTHTHTQTSVNGVSHVG